MWYVGIVCVHVWCLCTIHVRVVRTCVVCVVCVCSACVVTVGKEQNDQEDRLLDQLPLPLS